MNINRKIRRKLLRLLQRTVGLDRPQIYCEVVVRQGDKIIAKARNKFVRDGLLSLANHFAGVAMGTTYGLRFQVAEQVSCVGCNLQIRLGSDTTTPTTYELETLLSMIDVAPTSFVPSTDNPSAGVYRAIWTAVWNAGTISGTVGEMGLFCNIQKTLGTPTITLKSLTATMWSRLSSADGDFTSFTINETVPLSVEWRIIFQF